MKKISFLILTVFAAQLLSASYADDKHGKGTVTNSDSGNKATTIINNAAPTDAKTGAAKGGSAAGLDKAGAAKDGATGGVTVNTTA